MPWHCNIEKMPGQRNRAYGLENSFGAEGIMMKESHTDL